MAAKLQTSVSPSMTVRVSTIDTLRNKIATLTAENAKLRSQIRVMRRTASTGAGDSAQTVPIEALQKVDAPDTLGLAVERQKTLYRW